MDQRVDIKSNLKITYSMWNKAQSIKIKKNPILKLKILKLYIIV